jgi:transketolase
MALNGRYERSDYRVFVVIGDGEANEGSVWEAALCAAKHRLSNLMVLVDYNKYQSYGTTREVQDLEPFSEKWRSFGFAVAEVDGHCISDLRTILGNLPLHHAKPSTIVCHTVKGKGIPCVENEPAWHHRSGISDEEIRALFVSLESNR